jgi:mRNA interferase MazF
MRSARGEIWIIDLTDSRGHEQGGKRPVIVMASVIGMNIVIPLTTQIKVLNYPHTYLIEPTSSNGLSAPSIAMTFQIVAIDEKRLEKTIGKISHADNEIVKALLIDLMGLYK